MSYRTRVSRRGFLGGGASAIGLGALALAACGGSSKDEAGGATGTPVAAGEPKRGGTIRYPSTQLLGLDPMMTEGVAVAGFFYSYAVQLTDWAGTVGDLATSWEVANDVDWTFTLRSDARFPEAAPTNGRLLVASDLAKSIDRNKGMPGASESWAQYVESYEAVDDTTFKIRTKKPYAYLLWLLGICPIVPMEAVEQLGDLRTHAVGTGPFVLAQYERGAALNMVRNPLYYHDYPYIDGFNIKVIADEASIQAAFRANSVDVYDASNKAKVESLQGIPGTTISRYLDRGYANIRLNGAKFAPFKDERVREAVDISLDRKGMIDRIQFGDAELSGPVPPVFDTALPKEEVEAAYKRDVARAKQLLAAAGQEGMQFELFIGTGMDMPDQAAIIKANLADAGITVTIRSVDLGTWIAQMLAGDFEATVFNHLPYMTDDIPLQLLHSRGDTRTERNYLGVDDAQVDALLDQIHEEIDEAKRKDLAWEVQRLVLKRHGPTLLLYQPYGYWCAYDYIKGYTPTAYGFGLAKYDYWIDKS
ncbi:MAG TPA: ABC transporter substrate-binding protein [Dehalococcoidia bacterium]|nr:ABC transporter substrate-binding protein [Dehalococcoidia bacterium]